MWSDSARQAFMEGLSTGILAPSDKVKIPESSKRRGIFFTYTQTCSLVGYSCLFTIIVIFLTYLLVVNKCNYYY